MTEILDIAHCLRLICKKKAFQMQMIHQDDGQCP